jgi:cytochrome c biogenesis protein CcmG/thiol:disulfide interchange protein DsbE
MKRWQFIVPLAGFVVLLGFLGAGLNLNPREVPSPLIGKPAPEFSLPRLDNPAQPLTKQDLAGQVWVLNVWASWCQPCREEHPLLVDLARRSPVPLVGLNYKDKPGDAIAWLGRYGNPYTATASDLKGLVGIDYGVYGVPETFVIDRQGLVRFKHVGPLTPQVLRERLEPLLKELNA